MTDRIVTTDLPTRLNDVLAEIPDSEQGSRFQLLFFASATAIDVLRDLDFTHLEIDELAHREDLWEVLAPAVEDTTNSVAAFLECVRNLFGVEIEAGEASFDELESRLEELGRDDVAPPPAESPERQIEEVTALLKSICEGLTQELARFRSTLPGLRVHSDRWLLLDQIAMFRGSVRNGIGAMVYMAARLFLDVTREEVVPAYRDDLEHAVLLRRELGRLRDEVRLVRGAIDHAEEEGARRTLLKDVEARLHGFFESPTYLLVRAADKRPFADVRRDLLALLERDEVGYDEALSFTEGLTRFLESISAINGREILILHDGAAIDELKALLLEARSATERQQVERAQTLVGEALARCERLQGRDDQLDAVCRLLQHVPLAGLTPLEIAALVHVLETAL